MKLSETMIKKDINKAIILGVKVLLNAWQDFAVFSSMIKFVHYILIVIIQSGQPNKSLSFIFFLFFSDLP